MARRKVVRGEGKTRQEILVAATRRFASASYDNVSLRDIAADVGVDVAYVHRSFGSKERLFREVLDAHRIADDLVDVDRQQLPAVLARRLLERYRMYDPDNPDPLPILLHSLASPSASGLVAERLQGDFIALLQEKMGDPTPLRASLVMSLLIGLSILRSLLQLPAVTDMDQAQAEAVIASAIEGILGNAGT